MAYKKVRIKKKVGGEDITFEMQPIEKTYSGAHIDVLGKHWQSTFNQTDAVGIYAEVVDSTGYDFKLPIERIKEARQQHPNKKICVMVIVNQGGGHWISLPIEIDRNNNVTFTYSNSFGSGISPGELNAAINRNAELLVREGFKVKYLGTNVEVKTYGTNGDFSWRQTSNVSCGAFAFENARRKFEGRTHDVAPEAGKLRGEQLKIFVSERSVKLTEEIAIFPEIDKISQDLLSSVNTQYPSIEDFVAVVNTDNKRKLLLLLSSKENQIQRNYEQFKEIARRKELFPQNAQKEIPDKLNDQYFTDFFSRLRAKISREQLVEVLATMLTPGAGMTTAIDLIPEEIRSQFQNELVNLMIRTELIDQDMNMISTIVTSLNLGANVDSKIQEMSTEDPKKEFRTYFNEYKSVVFLNQTMDSSTIATQETLNNSTAGLRDTAVVVGSLVDVERNCLLAQHNYFRSIQNREISDGINKKIFDFIKDRDLTALDERALDLLMNEQLAQAEAQVALPIVSTTSRLPEVSVASVARDAEKVPSSERKEKEFVRDRVDRFFRFIIPGRYKEFSSFTDYYNERSGIVNALTEEIVRYINMSEYQNISAVDLESFIDKNLENKQWLEDVDQYLRKEAPQKGPMGYFYGVGEEAMKGKFVGSSFYNDFMKEFIQDLGAKAQANDLLLQKTQEEERKKSVLVLTLPTRTALENDPNLPKTVTQPALTLPTQTALENDPDLPKTVTQPALTLPTQTALENDPDLPPDVKRKQLLTQAIKRHDAGIVKRVGYAIKDLAAKITSLFTRGRWKPDYELISKLEKTLNVPTNDRAKKGEALTAELQSIKSKLQSASLQVSKDSALRVASKGSLGR